MGAMASVITSLTIGYSTFIQAQIKENIKASRYWPFVTGEFPAQKASNTEYGSIWWRHHLSHNSPSKHRPATFHIFPGYILGDTIRRPYRQKSLSQKIYD